MGHSSDGPSGLNDTGVTHCDCVIRSIEIRLRVQLKLRTVPTGLSSDNHTEQRPMQLMHQRSGTHLVDRRGRARQTDALLQILDSTTPQGPQSPISNVCTDSLYMCSSKISHAMPKQHAAGSNTADLCPHEDHRSSLQASKNVLEHCLWTSGQRKSMCSVLSWAAVPFKSQYRMP
jgi:hypothetical protein